MEQLSNQEYLRGTGHWVLFYKNVLSYYIKLNASEFKDNDTEK